ncbi:MAG: ABC transporter ATP-binding protein [Desulfococcaceae bacterium]
MSIPDSAPLIEAVGLTRIYPMGDARVVGLDGLDLVVRPGEMVVLKGRSGSGKSTLLALLAGLDSPTAGALTVGGVNLSAASDRRLTRYRRETVGMVFQSFNLLPTLSVLENVKLPALLAGESADRVESRARGLLDDLGMADRLSHHPDQLSGGEMQRTAIARALINDPALILADEPTGNLDSRNGEAVMALLADLNRERGRTLLVATHGDQADPYAGRRLNLADGRLVDSP